MILQGKDLVKVHDWDYYYGGSIRRYTVLMGSLLNGLKIERIVKGKKTYIDVPITYSVGKMYSRMQDVQDRETNRVALVLPLMTFELTNMEFDGTRQLNQTLKIREIESRNGATVRSKVNRIPYIFSYDLHVKTKTFDEMMQIMEQIVPAFENYTGVTIEDLKREDFTIESDIRVEMLGFEFVNDFDGPLDSTKSIVEATFRFNLYGHLYSKTQEHHQVLRVKVNAADLDRAVESTFTDVSADVLGDEMAADKLGTTLNDVLFEGANKV